MIQPAANGYPPKCSSSECGGYFPAGRYLTGALVMKSHVTLELAAGE
jgi:polygalacturonase